MGIFGLFSKAFTLLVLVGIVVTVFTGYVAFKMLPTVIDATGTAVTGMVTDTMEKISSPEDVTLDSDFQSQQDFQDQIDEIVDFDSVQQWIDQFLQDLHQAWE